MATAPEAETPGTNTPEAKVPAGTKAEQFLRESGGTTCITLLVQRRLSSKVVNMFAKYGDL